MQHAVEIVSLVTYLGAGALNWGVYGLGLFVGRKRLSLLERRCPPLPENPPRVSILIPAKNEGPRVAESIRGALSQDYPDFEVFAINDRSTDETGKVMDDIAIAERRLHVEHIRVDPPATLTGKCNALHATFPKSTGEWILFVDSDVILKPNALSKTMEHAIGRQYEMLSLILDLERHSFWESLVTPLASSAMMGMLDVPGSNQDRKKKKAFANGQFILIRRDVYESVGGHGALHEIAEDLELARLVKSRGHRTRVALGTDYATVRMYSSFQGIIRGWARNFSVATTIGKIIAAMVYTLVAGFSLYAAAAWTAYRFAHPANSHLPWYWLIATAMHFVLMTIFLGILYRWSSGKAWFALLFPVGGTVLLVVFLKAIKLCITKQVTWRGDSYVQPVISNGQ